MRGKRLSGTGLVASGLGLVLVAAGLSASGQAQVRGPAGPNMAPASVDTCASTTGGAAPTSTGDPDHQEMVSPTESAPHTVAWDGAQVVIEPEALAQQTSIGITRLADTDLAPLDSGMTNVTGKEHSGFRFTPHPMQFLADVTVSLPYDPAAAPSDFTAQDVFTYFYDDTALCWQVLQRVSVDEVNHTVTSLTNHFTDMINSTVTVPEHPDNVSFNPTQIKGLQTADPGSKVNLIAAPTANSNGDNVLSYPIEIPPGRHGMEPHLGIGYDSAGGNGWLGLGWGLSLPSITVDTRWGVPRYETATESETYLLSGTELTPVAHRGPQVARTAEKVFHTRVEGGFARIVRHGNDPTSYSWEVTDKAGVRSLYGGVGATLVDDGGNVFMWALREVRDTHGNFVRYSYVQVDDTGLDGGTQQGRNLYPKRITYTGSGTTEGRYAVTFVRDRELNELPLRLDKQIDARGGFKRVTADLLRRIDVTLDSGLIRRYQLNYTTGVFHKTLLQSIAQLDNNGTVFNTHEFSYFDDIRDGQGNYHAFSSAAWSVPGDDLSNTALNLTGGNAGNASALNANSSTSGGGHLYVGAGETESKSNSAGLKVGFNHTSNDGVLALFDVDGDDLPDKVFRTDDGVKYRKNLSGPHGQLRFADQAQPLPLDDGFMGESSNSLTVGVEAYPSPVALQLDYVNTFTTNDRYFSDVNGDGIADLVSGSSVLFGRIGANGTPVYGVSADTPVPVIAGHIDTSGLLGDLTPDRERLIDSFPLLDTLRRWVAPYAGVVQVQAPVTLAHSAAAPADGVRVAIQHEDTELWSDTIGGQDSSIHTPSNVDSITVAHGDRLYFRVQSGFDGSQDEVSWNPQISYLNVPATQDVNGLSAYRFQAARDFTLGGRAATVKAPLAGTLHLSGDLHKNAATTDDVTVLITRDGAPVLQQTLAAGATGVVPVNLDVTVQQGQKLAWRVQADSPIDLFQISWVPEAFYTAATGVDRLTNDKGEPLIDVFPPYNLDMYPIDGLTAPQEPFAVTDDVDLNINPFLTFNFGNKKPSGRVTFTVKRRGVLVAKRFFTITNGVVTAPAGVTIHAALPQVPPGTEPQPDELFFDFSTLDPTLRGFLTSQSVLVTPEGGEGVVAPSAFHSAAEEGAFPQPYRGWGGAGYNGNRDRAGQPIVQDDLVIDEDYRDQLPQDVDPQAQKDQFGQDPRVNPPTVVPFSPSPKLNRWNLGEHSFVTPTGASSSRLGVESISLPSGSDFASTVAVPRLSRSTQLSVTGSVGGPGSVGGSVASGDSTGQVDFMDMNGDQFPDVVSGGGIQYSDPTGGIGATRGDIPNNAVRGSFNQAGNASAGSPARTIATGAGQSSPTGEDSANTAQSGNEMPPFGVTLDQGGSFLRNTFDLIDMNGDGLPDRVYDNGQVALNLGYRFGAPENWRRPAALNDGSGHNGGLSLGFNTDFYGFAGGASYTEDVSSTASTLADMNGDGLPDRVFKGNPIMVGLNTGNGFEQAVPFLGSLPDINRDQNANLGGGVYFTFGICLVVVAVCIVINPGVQGSVGVSRTEQALRDLNGDGFVDHVSSTRDNQLVVAENRTGKSNLLRTVIRPLHGRMDFDYTRDGNTYGQPQSKFVLSRVTVDDKQPGDGQDVTLVTYEYSGGVFDRLEREFDGYATVVERHRDPGASDSVFRSVSHEFRTDGPYTRGLPTRTVTTDATGHTFLETESTYALRDIDHPTAVADPRSTTATIFPQLVRTDSRFFEGQASAAKATFTTSEYDQLGNVTRTFDAGEPGSADDLEARIGYTTCTTTNIVGIGNSIDVFGGGNLARHRESTVDCNTGDVSQVRAKLAGGETAVTDVEYFANGNVRAVTGPANKNNQRFRTDYGYDTTVDTYVESITDSFGFHSSTTHDFRFGAVLTSTDINHQIIRNTYDSVGRLVTVAGPYEVPENRITATFEYHPEASVPYAVTKHIDRQVDGVHQDTIDTITFVDGLGRAIQSKVDATVNGAAVMVVSGRSVYDFLGRVVQHFFPVTEPKGAANTTFNPAFDSVQPMVTSYDTLDRVTRTVLPDNTVSTTSYGFGADRSGATEFETVATDAKGKSIRTYHDVRQQTTTVKEFNPAGGQATIFTSYGYDALGQQTSIVDDHNNTTTMSYDNFGRETSLVSPDTGRTDTVYDLAGNVTKKITAKLAAVSKAIEYDYDFTRLSGIRYPVFPANNVTYTYGGPDAPNNSANRITSIVDGAGVVAREYGPLGELTKETRTVPAQGSHVSTFTTQYQYDTWNRVLRLTYPDGEVLSYHYNSGGQVDSAAGAKAGHTYPYLTRLDYDKFGERVLLDTGNGTRTRYTFNPTTRRLDNMKANLAQGYVFQNLNYSYDVVGNITTIQNDTVAPNSPDVGTQVGGPSTETFQYDDLYRLVHAEGSYEPRTPQTDQYRLDLHYDSISNLTGKDQVHELVSNGNTQTEGKLTYDYDYGYSAGRPHAPTTIGIFTFEYDANGNQTSRNQQPGPRRQMIWDEENRLACSHENTQSTTLPQTPASCDNPGGTPNDARYFYDDQGNRVVKDGAQFHIYPNQNYSTNGNHEFKHIYVGKTKLLTKTVEKDNRFEDRQFYSHDDRLGSTGFVTDASGGLAEHLQYIAGGETWVDEHPSQPVPQQYTGKELDPETGLYYYGARYYDPRTAVWQSADPALPNVTPGSKDLSAYLYARGNPITYNDPDGRNPGDEFSDPDREAPSLKQIKYHPGVEHNHQPTGKWSEVQQDAKQRPGWEDQFCSRRSAAKVAEDALGRAQDKLPLAGEHLQNYLTGKGMTFIEDANLQKMLVEDHGVAYIINHFIPKGQKTGRAAGHFSLQKGEYGIVEFEKSFGNIDRLDWEVNFDTGMVNVWFQDRYEWHPVYPFYDRQEGDDARENNCIHAAMVEMKLQGAQDYWMLGDATIPLTTLQKSAGQWNHKKRERI